MHEGRLNKNFPSNSFIQAATDSTSDYAIYRCEIRKDNELYGTAYAAVTIGQGVSAGRLII